MPGPTPTPEAAPESRDPSAARAEVETYLQGLLPIVEAASYWARLTDSRWRMATSPEERAGLVFVESRRIAALCRAVVLLEAPYEARPLHWRVKSALGTRQAWSAETADDLRAQGEPRKELAQVMKDTLHAIAGLGSEIESLADELGVDPAISGSPRRIVSERTLVSLEVPQGWIPVRQDSQTVVIAPPSLQSDGLTGLGIASDGYGTALRVRRLRNPPQWSLPEAIAQLDSLLGEYGDAQGERVVSVDGLQGVEKTVVKPELEWVTRLTVVVAGEFTFFFEMGCPATYIEACTAAMDQAMASAKLSA